MTNFTHESFKDLLNEVTLQLTEDLRAHNLYHDPKSFEDHVRSQGVSVFHFPSGHTVPEVI